mmetsp:Transcript_5988/g.9078  ORF Transcript_5988/g.9078 Transcript_5988/m.9078 type:complete len:84 (-) Transcript_5988:49-300(-)
MGCSSGILVQHLKPSNFAHKEVMMYGFSVGLASQFGLGLANTCTWRAMRIFCSDLFEGPGVTVLFLVELVVQVELLLLIVLCF